MGEQPRSTLFPYTTLFRSQLSHHDRARNDSDRRNGARIFEPVARQSLSRAPSALVADADAALSLHRNYRRVDYRGSRAPAVAHLWHQSPDTSVFIASLFRLRLGSPYRSNLWRNWSRRTWPLRG